MILVVYLDKNEYIHIYVCEFYPAAGFLFSKNNEVLGEVLSAPKIARNVRKKKSDAPLS